MNKQYLTDLLKWFQKLEKDLKHWDNENREFRTLSQEVKSIIERIDNVDPDNYSSVRDVEKEVEAIYTSYLDLCSNSSRNTIFNTSVPRGEHKLPALPYSYDALEPYIQKRIMELHHKKHHQSYVDGLNRAEKELQKQRKMNNYHLIKHWQRELAFHGAGHYLHTLFWQVMSPDGGGKPKGLLAEHMDLDFGSFTSFKEHFTEAATNVEGSGWAILVWVPRAGRLEILTAEKHQNLTQWDVIPLLPLDVWEHAYYLQYENERKMYVNNWWHIVNWRAVEDRFIRVRKNLWIE
ncbi:Fe-Mn family superoxide dismutase [Evansella tamaricis]